MHQVVLYRPEIPPNTGNVIRLCANMGAELHLVGPLGFRMDDADLRRASLDYGEYADVKVHADFDAYLGCSGGRNPYLVTVKGGVGYHEVRYGAREAFVFGNEAWGVPDDVLGRFGAERRLRIPQKRYSRSLNLANAVGIVLCEALRQGGFAGLD